MSVEKEISILKEQLETIKSKRYKAEAKLEELVKQREGILAEIKELNIDPNDLENEIRKMEQEVSELLKKTKEMLPRELL
ncbi:hypothetical protein HYG86_17840 [Alkalicella caledoniensis]|uniref:Uncharacterized protein n=1 Tax=Alkalicella caledoniensis TaxID=2731377 RepID=A0A7G9WCT9_ALKCA|nr:hypothetical protein [Alkalicella caledoniensis]QNO16501.1 hypothetical protein HYG86_17840 [Alkalicella caledoniensis]